MCVCVGVDVDAIHKLLACGCPLQVLIDAAAAAPAAGAIGSGGLTPPPVALGHFKFIVTDKPAM